MRRGAKVLGFLCWLALASAGCSASPSSAPTPRNDATTAYQGLVVEMAACGQQIAECVRGTQGDAAGLAACRDEREACVMGGGRSVAALAEAAGACAEQRRECASAGGEPAACSAELRICLGVPESVSDCVAELHVCIDAGGAPSPCAQQVHACVTEALPSPTSLMPGLPGDPNMPVDAGMPADPGASSDVPRAGRDRPVPDGLPVPARAAMKCLEAFQLCVQAGTRPNDCVEALRACATMRPGRP